MLEFYYLNGSKSIRKRQFPVSIFSRIARSTPQNMEVLTASFFKHSSDYISLGEQNSLAHGAPSFYQGVCRKAMGASHHFYEPVFSLLVYDCFYKFIFYEFAST